MLEITCVRLDKCVNKIFRRICINHKNQYDLWHLRTPSLLVKYYYYWSTSYYSTYPMISNHYLLSVNLVYLKFWKPFKKLDLSYSHWTLASVVSYLDFNIILIIYTYILYGPWICSHFGKSVKSLGRLCTFKFPVGSNTC